MAYKLCQVTNIINEIIQMKSIGVDITRISADSELAFDKIKAFKDQLTNFDFIALNKVEECNGYWHKIASMSVANANSNT
jgi:hypothetical protein